MPAGGFLEQKPRSPGSLAIVIALHGAAIGALLLSKTEYITSKFEPTVVKTIPEAPEPPPPEPEPVQRVQEPPKSVIRHVPPRVDLRPADPVVLGEVTDVVPLPTPGPIGQADPTPEPAPPPPPPPPPAQKVEPARARANLASYVSDADYPASAIRSEEQGTTRFRLTVGPDGRVKDCTVTSSSGSSALDAATCRIMRNRARFTAARDTSGQATSDTVASAIRWVHPTD